MAPALGFAGEILILAPYEPQSLVLSRNKIINVVVKVADAQDLDRLVLYSEMDNRRFDPAGRYEKGGSYYVHYSLYLRKGDNNLILDPIRRPLQIKYMPVSTLLNLNFDRPHTYLFHRDAVVPAECTACHDDKLPSLMKKDQPAYGRTSPECFSCHPGKPQGAEWKHSPAASLLCLACHGGDTAAIKVRVPTGKVEGLCFSCHNNQQKWLAMAHIHGPVGTGDCTICHDPHGSKNRYQLWADGKARLCVICHEDKARYANTAVRQKLQVHGILRGQGCVICHDPHASPYRFQLVAEINDLCVSCHVGLQETESGHPVQNHPISKIADPLRPGVTMSCTSCHNPHGSDYDYLLIGDPRGGVVCGKCHAGRPKPRRFNG
jgi:predicted CXXCH cytochrome family protein